MLASHLAQVFGRPQANKWASRSQVRRQKWFEITGGKRLFRPISKIFLIFCATGLLVNFLLSQAVHSRADAFFAAEAIRHELQDRNIGLRAQKARLFSPDQVEDMAGKQLGLYVSVVAMEDKKNKQWILYAPDEKKFIRF